MDNAALVHPTTHTGFAARLRTETRREHQAAEDTRFVAALARGELPLAAYTALLGQTYLVYVALEAAGRQLADHPVAGQFVDEALLRVPSLQADLDHLLGTGWSERLHALPATRAYVTRLQEVAASWPGGFVAHHYVRYLGDLSGGQILRRAVQDTYGMSTDGVRFYIFDAIPKPKPYKDTYRHKLDTAPWDTAERDRIVEEARHAFRLNGALFNELGRQQDAGVGA